MSFTKSKKMIGGLALLIASLAVGGMAIAHEGGGAKFAEKKAEILARFDTNKDGKLDAGERQVMRTTMMGERFTKLDTNGDGVISRDEFLAGAGKGGFGHHGHRGHHHDGRGPTGANDNGSEPAPQ